MIGTPIFIFKFYCYIRGLNDLLFLLKKALQSNFALNNNLITLQELKFATKNIQSVPPLRVTFTYIYFNKLQMELLGFYYIFLITFETLTLSTYDVYSHFLFLL